MELKFNIEYGSIFCNDPNYQKNKRPSWEGRRMPARPEGCTVKTIIDEKGNAA